MKILSLDVSLNCPGFAFYDGKSIIYHGHIKMKQKMSTIEKVNATYDHVDDLIKKYNPDVVLIEQYLTGHTKTKSSTLISLGGVNVSIQLCCYKNNVDVELIYPQSWKACLKRHFGAFEKDDIIKLMNDHFNISLDGNDSGDACGMIFYKVDNLLKFI